MLFTASDGWVFFFTSFPILDLEHFSQVILWIVLQIMPPQITPTIRCCSQHLMVGFFFDLFSYSGLRAFFTSDFTNCTTDYAPPQITPTIRCYSGLRAFFTSDLWIVLQIMPPPQITRTIRCYSQHLMVFFFDLFSYSGLRAFFTSDLTNCTTDYAHPPKEPKPSGAVHSIWWLGVFFGSLLLFWT